MFMKKIRLEKLENLIDALGMLPTVGRKSAKRYAFYMLLNDSYCAMKIAHAIEDAVIHIKKCKKCGNLSENEICDVCYDESRDIEKLCIVDNVKDIFVLEDNTEYEGRYFVFEDLEEETMQRLSDMIEEGVSEIIFALTPSLSNDALILFIEDKLKDKNLTFTKIAQGVPTGVNLENVDMLSLSKAINGRVKI